MVLISLSSSLCWTQTYNILHSFNGSDGSGPLGSLLQDAEGNLYGVTISGGASTNCSGAGCGAIFKLATNGQETVLYSFTGGGDGESPEAGLVRDGAGNFYGTASVEGSSKCQIPAPSPMCGTVFELNSAHEFTVLHQFLGPDGASPWASLLFDGGGHLYGTSKLGGVPLTGCSGKLDPTGCGTVFRLERLATGEWAETVVHNFKGGRDGFFPVGNLIRDSAGNLYGTNTDDSVCANGRGKTCGNVFKLTHTSAGWTSAILYTFHGANDGAQPQGGLVIDEQGNLYGTDTLGGDFGFGTIFKIDATGHKTTLHSFTGSDGAYPVSGVVRDSAGNLYGSAQEGGANKVGSIFELDTARHLTVLHSFAGGSDGAYPGGPVFRDKPGNLYGTTVLGGSFGQGILFEITH